MIEGDMLIIKVPASTANLGPGFDSVGLALNLYLSLEVEKADKWEVIALTEELKDFPTDETNFIISVALNTAKKYNVVLPPCRIKVNSEIPLARGLGSSASAIVAGIELANSLGNLQLTKHEKLEIANEIEGHPDNVGPSIFGGLIIGCMLDNEVDIIHSNALNFDVVAAVPKEELLTKASRGVLPEELPFFKAVSAGAVGNVMIAALLSGDIQLAGKMMSKDLFHQPYRKKLVPHYEQLEEAAIKSGAYGMALSGAGPTVICLVEKGKGPALIQKLNDTLPKLTYLDLKVDLEGSTITLKNKVI